MEKFVALWWAIIWGLVCVLCVIAIFWNPAHVATGCISALMCGVFLWDYFKTEKRKK